jgi:hypothetical protein
MPAGRPTDYRPEFCERVIELGRNGRSVAQMASILDVSKGTLYLWAQVHPEFSDALSLAKTHAQAIWEEKGETGLESREFNAGLYKVSMSARFPDDYSDRQKIDHSSSDGTMTPPSAIVIRPYDPSKDA